ncbi:MAG: hypothetical protein IT428_06050 [Planctomycetaceae bacterium]|nr:hypothetical protein [Planctomycetaceae bacterium]
MLNRLTRLTALACVLMLPLLSHAGPPDPAEAELPTLSNLVIVSGEPTLTGALPALTPEAKLIADNFEGATAATDRSTLVIGIKSDHAAGTVLLRANYLSDCPDNTRFQAVDQVVEAVSNDQLRSALLTWTRIRHDALKAPQRQIVTSPHYSGGTVFDVRLDLKQLSSR